MLPALDRGRPLAAITLGRAGMDLYPDPDGTSIEDAKRFFADLGGAGGNIAIAMARQGVRSALVTAFSDDAVGRHVMAGLARYGVDTSRCCVVGGEARTSLAVAETRASDCEVVIYRNGAADLQADAHLDLDFLAQAEALIVTGTCLAAEPSRSMCLAALAIARQAATFTILDIDHRPYSWPSQAAATAAYGAAARLSDAVVGNAEEFAILSGGAAEPDTAAKRLIHAGASFVVVKKGATGSVTFTRDDVLETGVFKVTVKKPFGAGDSFLGGLVAALVTGKPLRDALSWGSAAAAIVVSRRGCASAMPTLEEVSAMMANGVSTAN
jgi:5-dehydro-2-deoxygluconokinase